MASKLWDKCLECADKCCGWKISFPLYVTEVDKEKHPRLNTTSPCRFYNASRLCDIHQDRPYDCRFFPFDVMKIGTEFFWITWQTNCLILAGPQDEFEGCLRQHERELVPAFNQHLEQYSQFRLQEFLRTFPYRVLRRINQ